MKILHTSDWHLGRSLFGRKRYDEFERLLGWLLEIIGQNQADVLLIAGDVFDTSTPNNRAQELYYRFLRHVADAGCRHVVVIAGNHDSPSFLNAPKELLRALNVHVIGSVTEDREDEVLVLRSSDGEPEVLVCAVPYLRDRDIRVVEPGESSTDKVKKLVDGIQEHYQQVGAIAERKRQELGVQIPIVAMGHLFTAGARTVEGDGVRELYVGSLAHVPVNMFHVCFDYVALGHLHLPQKVGDAADIRYSGAPLPIGFGEARIQKVVSMVEISDDGTTATEIPVPVFQPLERIRGDWEEIHTRILELSASSSQAWLEIVYEGQDIIGDLRERLDEVISETEMEILRVKNSRISEQILSQMADDETLDDLTVDDVFERCLAEHDVPDAQRPSLRQAYQDIVTTLHETDARAE